jgi:signal transduction histidine kinase
VKPRPERTETDSSLRTERERTDEHLEKRGAAVERDADAVMERARARADSLLEATRDREDADLAPSEVQAEQALRSTEDQTVSHERAAADAMLVTERAASKRKLVQWLSSEREETDDRLHTERSRSDYAVASRDDFLAIVSHDVRGLLDALSMSAELLTRMLPEGEAGEPPRQVAGRIGRLTGRMSRLVNDLLDVVSMESGRLKVIVAPQDPSPLLTEVVEVFQPLAAARGIRLTLQIPEGVPLACFDHDRILQVLTNLVGNAMKFTADGGEITLSLSPTTGGVGFSVRDTGCGIAADLIFERFAQVTQGERPGLGLGLYIARCIVEAHEGRIWVESEPGSGSTFHVTLPQAP